MLHVEAVTEVSRTESDCPSVALVVVRAIASVQVEVPRFFGFLADDVDDSPYGIRAVERRCRSFYDFDAFHIVQVQAAVVDVVQSLARQAFAVH